MAGIAYVTDRLHALTRCNLFEAGADRFAYDRGAMDMKTANAEIFGPVGSIIHLDKEEEAVEMANDTPYGLAAYFYTRDMA